MIKVELTDGTILNFMGKCNDIKVETEGVYFYSVVERFQTFLGFIPMSNVMYIWKDK